MAGFVTVAGLAGGTLGYAGYDPEFRKVIEETVPGSKDVFAAVLGDAAKAPEELEKVSKATPSKLKPPSSIPITTVTPLPPLEVPPIKATIEPPAKEKPKEEEEEEAPKKTPPVKVKTDEEKAKESKEAANMSLSYALDEACHEMERVTGQAVKAADGCVDAVRHHMALVRNVMESGETDKGDERAWNEVFEAAAKKSDMVKAAQAKLAEARAMVKKALDCVESGRKDPHTASNSALAMADKKAIESVVMLEKALTSVDSAQKEARLVEQYRDLVEEGRQQFQKEIAAILPDAKLGQKGAALTEEELNVFMTHAYRKVCGLQQELAKLQTIEKRKMPTSLGGDEDDQLQAELDTQRRELEVEYHRKMAGVRDEMESEMRSQLRRQAAAHADHINDVLEVQGKELARLHQRHVDEAVHGQKEEHKRMLSSIVGKLDGLEKSLADKAFMNAATKETQELWLACVGLQRALKYETSDEDTLPLKGQLEAIKNAVDGTEAFADDKFVKVLLEAVPAEAKKRGVFTEATIRGRFARVEQMAKRTALVGDQGGSLLLYALSYLQSVLMMRPSLQKMPDPERDHLDVEQLSTFDIVWLARGSLERGDLEQAVKYMNLLTGEPRNQAKDWLKEARLLLETEQACDALIAYAAAVGVEAVPAKRT